MADTTRASKLQVFFRFLFFFFLTQVRQVKVVFLRTLRNAATRLKATEESNFFCRLVDQIVDVILPGQTFVEGDSEVAMSSNLGDVVVVDFDVELARGHSR